MSPFHYGSWLLWGECVASSFWKLWRSWLEKVSLSLVTLETEMSHLFGAMTGRGHNPSSIISGWDVCWSSQAMGDHIWRKTLSLQNILFRLFVYVSVWKLRSIKRFRAKERGMRGKEKSWLCEVEEEWLDNAYGKHYRAEILKVDSCIS